MWPQNWWWNGATRSLHTRIQIRSSMDSFLQDLTKEVESNLKKLLKLVFSLKGFTHRRMWCSSVSLKKKLCWDSLKSLQRNHCNSGTWGLLHQIPDKMQQIFGMMKKWCKGTLNGPCMGNWLKKLLEGTCMWASFLGKGEQLFEVVFIFLAELQHRPWRCEVALFKGSQPCSGPQQERLHPGLMRHLLVAPVSSGLRGVSSAPEPSSWLQTFLLFVWDRPRQQIKRERGKWLTWRLSWCSAGPVLTAACGGRGRLWPSASWDPGMTVAEGPAAGTTAVWSAGHWKCGGTCPELRGSLWNQEELLFLPLFRQKTGTSRI